MVERGVFYGIPHSRDFLQALITVLRDEDRAVRMKSLAVLANYMSEPAVRAAFEEVAAQNDPVLAAEAKMRLPK